MNRLILSLAFILTIPIARAQNKPLSEQMAATVMDIWADSLSLNPEQPKPVKWAYDQGVVLEGIDGIWRRTANGDYFKYMQKSMDFFVTKEGTINRYKQQDYNIDHLKNGRTLLTLYKVTGQQKYFKAATLLWEQLKTHPRTAEGGFWHKKIYPQQMWLDGLYMGQPFYAEYATLVNDDKSFDDIAKQFILMEKHSRDARTGLLYHGWDASKTQQWANRKTGQSPNFWARAMGWYAMALVDVLDYFPAGHPKRKELLSILSRLADAIKTHQDKQSGLWYDILDKPDGKGNYHEASASCMFVYSIAKGVRKAYLPNSYFAVAQSGYNGIQKEFVEQRSPNKINLKGTVSVSGLGGKPYRDGSYEYYMSEKVITNDPKGVGAFLLAANEMEIAALPKPGAGKNVMLDSYFNNEKKKDQSGNLISWHYKWDERANGGFSFWGDLFENNGFKTTSLAAAPDKVNLSKASVYIIVDPDIEKENPKPNYIGDKHITDITDWVKAGGVLILMANDTGNAELNHFNTLAQRFGITFNMDSKGRVVKDQYEMARIRVQPNHPIFKTAKQLYIKEYSTLKLSNPASSVLKDDSGNDVIAVSGFGKGRVFAIGDPWLYNEYVDGRKLPAEYDNFKAAEDVINWITPANEDYGPDKIVPKTDPVAEHMLIHQRSVGGWPKAINKVPVDYTKVLTTDEQQAIKADSLHNDATIDNKATTTEISYLVSAYSATGNPAYLASATRGVKYLLKAQYENGGWPQYYPDHSLYRGQITYNDNAMVNVLNVLQDIVEEKNDFAVLKSLKDEAATAVQNGISCILKTQVKVNGVPTVWCAQYDQHTMQPAKARAFELISLSGMESVNIVEFLMRIKNPSAEVIAAIDNAMKWFEKSKITGYNFVSVKDPKQPGGKDKVLKKDDQSTIWARFYDIKTNEPFFTGRNSLPKKTVAEIEVERRVGYAWYGTWPQKLFDKKYPAWLKLNKS